MTYSKNDALMTKGMAILCMVVLHLFCRKGADVFGSPLLWVDQETPLVYWFGFYAEICVAVYSICIGYAQYLLYENGKTSWKYISKRILKLMVNYWIILILFSIAGLLYSTQHFMPGSLIDFLKNIVLLYSYNGAWWFLNTYILFLLIPASVKFGFVEKTSMTKGIISCFLFHLIWYVINKIGLIPAVPAQYAVLSFFVKELKNLIGILPAVYIGVFMCKGNLIPTLYDRWCKRFGNNSFDKLLLFIMWIVLFIAVNIIHKAVLTLLSAFITFILFNLWKKGKLLTKVFSFLGFHSTNIWLTHTFFYTGLFGGVVQSAEYPIFMLLFLLLLCITVSYLVMAIAKLLDYVILWIKQQAISNTE